MLVLCKDRSEVISYVVFFVNISLLSLLYLLTGTKTFLPLFTISFFWLNSIWLSTLKIGWVNYLSHFEDDLKFIYVLMFYLSYVLFIIAFFLGYVSLPKLNFIYDQKQRDKKSNYAYYVVLASFLIGGGVMILSMLSKGTIPLFSADINEVRDDFYINGVGGLVILLQVTIASTILYKISNSLDYSSNRKVTFLAFAALILMVLTSQRIGIIESILLSFALSIPYASKLRVGIKKIFVISFVSLLLFTIFIYVGVTRGLNDFFITDFESIVAEQAYVYFGGPALRNLQYAIETNYYGMGPTSPYPFMFRSFLTPIIGVPVRDMGEIFVGPNNGTAFLFYFYDFGWLGFVFPLMPMAFITGLSAKYYFNTNTLLSGLFFGVMFICAFFLPLTDKYFDFSTVVKILIFVSFSSFMRLLKNYIQE